MKTPPLSSPPSTEPRTLCAHGVEVWAPVPETPYEASNLGRVRNPKTGRFVGTCRLKNGYFSLPGLLVHRAVLAAFDGPQPPRIVARHLNDDRGDNRLTNLAWGTRADNAADTMRAGRARTRTGELVASLDAEQVDAAFSLLQRGEITQQQVAARLQRSEAWVSYELRARTVPLTTVRDPVDESEARLCASRGVEVWARAVGSHGLEVSNLGRVRDARSGRVYAFRPEKRSGYIKVQDVGLLHRIVMLSFSDEPFPGAIVRHGPDPARTNCALHNLRWGTYADNGEDTVAHGRSLRGEQHPRATLTDAKVEEGLRRYAEEGWTTDRLSDFFGGIGQGNASDIVNGKSWAHVPRPEWLTARMERMERRREASVLSPTLPVGGSLLDHLVARTDALTAQVAEGFRLRDDDHTVLTREEIILATREAGRDAVEARLFPSVFAFLRAHVARNGWFYPSSDESLAEALATVRREQVETPDGSAISGRGRAGTAYLQGRFRSFWDVDDGPSRAFAKDNLLRSVLRYRMGLNNSKDYTYTLSSGESVTTRETFAISAKNVRRGFIVQRQTASFFKASAAFTVYRRWIEGTDSPVVWDASCGFGARLLGFAAAFPRGIYIGNEPASRTYADVASLAEDLVRAGSLAAHTVVKAGSEVEAPFADGTLDLVFTSPPYFDLERYYDEPGQCWRDYPTLALWRSRYLLPTLLSAHRGLKAAARLVLNVDEERRAVVVETAQAAGFVLVAEQTLLLGSDHFARKRGDTREARGEPVLVFVKA